MLSEYSSRRWDAARVWPGFFFFFQAEDGIRDHCVTGVQTCALPIFIVFSDGVEALGRGARLAEEARHPVAEDVTAVLYPDAIARANGTDVKTALALVMAQVQAAQSAQAPKGAMSGRQLESFEEMVSL